MDLAERLLASEHRCAALERELSALGPSGTALKRAAGRAAPNAFP